jgi:hypothetical protein
MPDVKIGNGLVKSILEYGDRYTQEMLAQRYHRRKLTTDWWEALCFFYRHAFYQGRLDSVSKRVLDAALDVLRPIFQPSSGPARRLSMDTRKRAGLRRDLRHRIGKGKVGKARDVEMTLSALEYVSRLPQNNIVSFSLAQIRAGAIEDHFRHLQRRLNPKGIVQVGPKIAALYLRDVVSFYGLQGCVPDQFQSCLQPIDVWVRKLAHRTGIGGKDASDERIRQAIVDLCKSHRCSALQFNQGAWYVGRFAFGLLLERISQRR